MAAGSRPTAGQRNDTPEDSAGDQFSRKRTRRTLIAAAAGLLLGCAEVAPPPGGEIDRIGPALVESFPPNGALNVAPGHEILIVFSERVNRPAKGRAIFISPRPRLEPKIKWESDRVHIRLFDRFEADQTYVVTVSTDVADLRNNRLDSAITVAFSTGAAIDSGSVSGRVTQAGKPASGMPIGLYRLDSLMTLPVYDSVFPTYVTTTNAEGAFSFRYLPDGTYALLGFDDLNRDERFNQLAEPFALPDRPIVVGGPTKLDNLSMTVTRQDTISPAIVGATTTADNLVRLRLNEPIPTDLLKDRPGRLTMRSRSDTTSIFSAAGFLEADSAVNATVTAFFENLPDGSYAVSLVYDSLASALLLDSLVFQRKEDKTAPTVQSVEPAEGSHFADVVTPAVKLSEPVDAARLTPSSFMLWQNDSTPVAIAYELKSPFVIELRPERLLPGRHYRLDIAEFDVVDRAGNKLGDSVLSRRFATLDRDSLGSVTGELSIALPDRAADPVVLAFQKAGETRRLRVTVAASALPAGPPADTTSAPRPFSIDLPAGRYLLSGFIDSDRDGRLFEGSIRPFRLAETRFVYPDTVGVRARFETAGLSLKLE